ncbi:hypothetical protein VZ94_13810 [Methylocucumis oryzae]|uniref:RhiE-like KS-MAT linker domain-containing protein n=1 Tax=Methylocucumis oryzae TaxID=1632867 RepID=A0A0F3IH14_9GAMM|nr:hypothetical protein VZ94_13810 [Methylocucumis oryzae]
MVGAYQPAKNSAKPVTTPCILPVSAKQPDSLHALLIKLRDYVNANQDRLALADIAYTLQIGREAMPERCVFIADSVTNWLAQLEQAINHAQPLFANDKMANAWLNGQKRRLAAVIWCGHA